jgi:fructose-specific phosphotransferase system IIA component
MDTRRLASFLHEEFFIPELTSATKEKVLEELVQPLMNSGKVKSKSLILETLKRRETLGSTGIGKGIAVPHCRTSVVSEIHIVVGISNAGIPYDAIDKKDVKIFFLIVAPPQEETNLYLPILGKIVEMVRNARTRRALRKVNDYASLLKVIQGG